jgi:hypothetical protein
MDEEDRYTTSNLEELMKVVPAQLGFYLMRYHRDDKSDWTSRVPIIAWAISAEEDTIDNGVTLTPVCLDSYGPAYCDGVLCPDGRVEVIGSASCRNEIEWLEYARERYNEKAKKSGKLEIKA